MGYWIVFSMRAVVRPGKEGDALRAVNELHTVESLVKYARGAPSGPKRTTWPASERWYAFVNNPETPYASLAEAMKNWQFESVEESRDERGRLVLAAEYDMKEGQVAFLLGQLAPYLEDTSFDVR